ncbi:putative quinol monooxygenase [Streptomyces sp. WMMB 322]|uniref:putative quinol monooxygenase n=1 Tax=Streptomyces sp. WMMB 322 TaxID=1286821 RepID=UPI0006E1FE79|nr:antibiotic biosynthesis monooxygenase [Streptomyces sp. WMMB 322]SCK19384.1 Quinol monooxygenase YgiN [Streptomyces sp. WMMB 322]
MSIFVRVRFDVSDEQRAEFEQLALALCEHAEGGPGILTYRFFSSGSGRYALLEEYADTAAALAHNESATELLDRVRKCTESISVELYGPLGPELHEWVRERPHATSYAEFPDPGGES